MIELYLVVAVALLAMGFVIGVLLIVSIGIHRDERAFRRRKVNATGYAADGARRLLTGRRVQTLNQSRDLPMGGLRGSYCGQVARLIKGGTDVRQAK